MKTTRRHFGKELALATTGLTLCGCRADNLHSPTAPPAPQPQQQPQPPSNPTLLRPAAEKISPPESYSFAVRANESFESVTKAFEAAGAEYRENAVGQIVSIDNRTSSSWKLDINAIPFCTNAGLARVPAGATIACYIEDRRKVASCLSDRPA